MTSNFLVLQLLGVWFCHWIADFVVQTDWQAKNKSKNNWALTDHAISYFYTFLLFGCYWELIFGLSNILTSKQNYEFAGNWIVFCLINTPIHWITDYFTSRLNSKLWAKGDTHTFFESVGFDQFLHAVALFLTYSWIVVR